MIITHTNPDWDAITGVWLLKRFWLNDDVDFVNTGNSDPALLKSAGAVVDTGKVYNPDAKRFDHHQLPDQASNDTCATKQVYEWLCESQDLAYLKPLIDLVFAGDTGRREADFSRELGLHALLSGFKGSAKDKEIVLQDQTIMMFGLDLLDIIESRLRYLPEAKKELAKKVIYKSSDSLLWAIKEGSQASSYAAYEEGVRLVLFQGEPVQTESVLTYPVGMMRAGEWQEPHAGNLATMAQELAEVEGCFLEADELARWFKHPAGFFAGRGTAKAPMPQSFEGSLLQLAILIDKVWQR